MTNIRVDLLKPEPETIILPCGLEARLSCRKFADGSLMWTCEVPGAMAWDNLSRENAIRATNNHVKQLRITLFPPNVIEIGARALCASGGGADFDDYCEESQTDYLTAAKALLVALGVVNGTS